MRKEMPHWYKHALRNVPLSLVVAASLGMAGPAQGQEPFCTPDDLCVEVVGRVTGYLPNAPDGVETKQCIEPCHETASGVSVVYGITAACPTHVPFGVRVFIAESTGNAQGRIYVCEDRGDMNKTDIDIAVRYHPETSAVPGHLNNPDSYTDLNARIVYKYREGPGDTAYSSSDRLRGPYTYLPE